MFSLTAMELLNLPRDRRPGADFQNRGYVTPMLTPREGEPKSYLEKEDFALFYIQKLNRNGLY